MNTDARVINILSAKMAKDLIRKQEFNLIDITANKTNKDRTVFIFESTKRLKDYLLEKHDLKIN